MCIVCQARTQKPEFCYRLSDYTDAIDLCGKIAGRWLYLFSLPLARAARPHCVACAWAKHVWEVLRVSNVLEAAHSPPRGQHLNATVTPLASVKTEARLRTLDRSSQSLKTLSAHLIHHLIISSSSPIHLWPLNISLSPFHLIIRFLFSYSSFSFITFSWFSLIFFITLTTYRF